MSNGRLLNVGDEAMTDFKGGWTLVKIISKQTGAASQTGVRFQVHPPLNKYTPMTWYDSDWFEPVSGNLI